MYHPMFPQCYIQKLACSGVQKKNNKKKEGKWGIDGGTETYLVGKRDESFEKAVSQLLSILKGGGVTAAPAWIFRDNGSKGRKL